MRGRIAIGLLAAVAIGMPWTTGPAGADRVAKAGAGERFQVLVYSRTTGFRHASIPFGVRAISELGAAHSFGVTATEDPKAFRTRSLRKFEAVIFLNTTGTILNESQKSAVKRYIRAGGGYMGIHSAADTEHSWPFYDRLVGTLFLNHPLEQTASFHNEAPRNPATAHLDSRFSVFDEFYAFKQNPRPNVRVLLSIDEGTYLADPNTSHLPGGTPSTGYMGDHPMSWCHTNIAEGRTFYTALGHEAYLYFVDWYRRHLLGGIRIAADRVRANCAPRPE